METAKAFTLQQGGATHVGMPPINAKATFTLAERNTHVDMSSTLAKVGFTLAEVLITLGIIGIVAAMTIPALHANIQKKIASTKLKSFYSKMKQMVKLAEEENGPVYGWNTRLPQHEFYDTYFVPYLNVTREADALYFPDGSSFKIVYYGECLDFLYDYNGKKRPNKIGVDNYYFLICEGDHRGKYWCPEDGFCSYYPRSWRTTRTRAELVSMCRINPAYCSALLEFDRWNFSSDYPW